jgi:hypothetical protein
MRCASPDGRNRRTTGHSLAAGGIEAVRVICVSQRRHWVRHCTRRRGCSARTRGGRGCGGEGRPLGSRRAGDGCMRREGACSFLCCPGQRNSWVLRVCSVLCRDNELLRLHKPHFLLPSSTWLAPVLHGSHQRGRPARPS